MASLRKRGIGCYIAPAGGGRSFGLHGATRMPRIQIRFRIGTSGNVACIRRLHQRGRAKTKLEESSTAGWELETIRMANGLRLLHLQGKTEGNTRISESLNDMGEFGQRTNEDIWRLTNDNFERRDWYKPGVQEAIQDINMNRLFANASVIC